MPNYSLVANSTFQPFTYQELMMPIERQNQYFEKLAEEYDKMSSQADVLEAMGSSDLDKNSGTYNRYKAYSDNLRKERDNLYANGLNMDSRQRLSDLRRMYNTEIVPIQNAWQKREQEAQMQMKARMDAAARGIDIRFSRDAANSSLDTYLQNPNQGFQVINGQQITNEVANQFKGLASQVQSDGKGNYFLKGKPLNPIEYSIITQKGMDWNHFQDFINNPNDSRFANLRGIIENTLNAHGIRNFDENTYRDMFNYGAQGVAAGVGARDIQLHTDAYANDLMNFQQQIALQDRAHQHAIDLARAKGEIGGGNGGSNDPTVTSEYVGMKTSDQYRADGMQALSSLKGGRDGLKASVFGTTIGKVNPMAIYKEYQQELKKHTGAANAKATVDYSGGHPVIRPIANTEKAKEAVLKKYRKYGVTDILTEDQYNLLSGMGYSDKDNIKSNRFSNLQNKFNDMVVAQSSYSTHMSNYNYADDEIRRRLQLRNEEKSDLGIWKIDKEGRAVKDNNYGALNLYDSETTKGNKVSDIQYDPRFKGKIVAVFSGGRNPGRRVIDPALLAGDGLTSMIKDMEARGMSPMRITQELKYVLNSYNKTKSTSEKDD